MTNGLLIYGEIFAHFLIHYIRKPFLIYDFATAPLWMKIYMKKIWFSFYQCVDTLLIRRQECHQHSVSTYTYILKGQNLIFYIVELTTLILLSQFVLSYGPINASGQNRDNNSRCFFWGGGWQRICEIKNNLKT